jgi:hypothetical protein
MSMSFFTSDGINSGRPNFGSRTQGRDSPVDDFFNSPVTTPNVNNAVTGDSLDCQVYVAAAVPADNIVGDDETHTHCEEGFSSSTVPLPATSDTNVETVPENTVTSSMETTTSNIRATNSVSTAMVPATESTNRAANVIPAARNNQRLTLHRQEKPKEQSAPRGVVSSFLPGAPTPNRFSRNKAGSVLPTVSTASTTRAESSSTAIAPPVPVMMPHGGSSLEAIQLEAEMTALTNEISEVSITLNDASKPVADLNSELEKLRNTHSKLKHDLISAEYEAATIVIKLIIAAQELTTIKFEMRELSKSVAEQK